MSYTYDVFISYRREVPRAVEWTRELLAPTLRDFLHLDHAIPADRVFLDDGLQVGAGWAAELDRALLSSRVLVAVLSADYFQSPWCTREWTTLQARAEATGVSLVCALQVWGGEHYPAEAKAVQMLAWHDYSVFTRAQRRQLSWTRAVQGLARTVKQLVDSAPAFDCTWTISPGTPTVPQPGRARM